MYHRKSVDVASLQEAQLRGRIDLVGQYPARFQIQIQTEKAKAVMLAYFN